MPDDSTIHIADLKAKLVFLRNEPAAQEVGRHTGSQPGFARAIGVSRSTANGWLEEYGTQRSSIPSGVSLQIAVRFKFPSVDWSPWLMGSVEVFTAEYRKLAQELRGLSPSAPAVPRDVSAPLMQGDDIDPERCPIRGLASLELTCGQTGPGQTNIGARVSCGISPIESFPFLITVHTAQLEIDCGKARAAVDSIKGFADPGFTVRGSKGEVRGTWNGGDTQRLVWLLDATAVSLGVVTFDPGELARVERLAPGDGIAGTLGTWFKNIEADETSPRPTYDIGIVEKLGNPVEIEGKDFSVLQRRIMEHLRKCALEVDGAGYAILARHELRFVRRP